jgi:hypothetical protein
MHCLRPQHASGETIELVRLLWQHWMAFNYCR